MFGTIEVPEQFYDCGKRYAATVATRRAPTPKPAVNNAAVEAAKKASQQAAVQRAKAEKAVTAAKAVAEKAEKNAAAEQSEPAEETTETAAIDEATKREAAASASPTRLWAPIVPLRCCSRKTRAFPSNATLRPLGSRRWRPHARPLLSRDWWSGGLWAAARRPCEI